ncbi:MAG: 1-phosphofructokinase family hexose kinase [Enhydrobacter sp.]
MKSPAILTLTINPALDMAAEAAAVRPVHKIRTFGEHCDPGGGGINVARVVHELGGDALALFASGGASGQLIENMLSDTGTPYRSVPIAGVTRVSFTVRDRSSGLEYRFVPQGPELSAADGEKILAALSEFDANWIVASGSLPPGVAPDFYARAASIAKMRGARFVLDTSGPALKAALRHGVDLLKPSLGEFESIVGREVRDPQSQAREGRELIRSGAARMIALTLGRDGAMLVTNDNVIRIPAIEVVEKSAVGAGDSFLAGLVLGLARGQSDKEALQLAIAAAAAAVSSPGTAHVRRTLVETLLARGPA